LNFKPTLILAGLLILVAGVVFYFHWTKPGQKQEARPEIWSVDEAKIHHITIRLPHQKKMIACFQDKEEHWRFDDASRQAVDLKRWGGIVILVSGPKSKRLIAEKVGDLGEFGLTDPQMIVTLGVKGRKDPLEILFGGLTPGEDHYYVKLKHSAPVYLIHSTYVQVLMRLVLEPPLPPVIPRRTEKS
jgi:hypothetical protein